jgi:hypothetical protein
MIDGDGRKSVSPGADCKPGSDPLRSVSRNIIMINCHENGAKSCILSPLLLLNQHDDSHQNLRYVP